MAIAYGAILVMALLPIYVGSHRSLSQKATETMSAENAWKFPFVGSAVLFGFYILFKICPKEYINLLLTAYFVIFSVGALTATITPWISYILPSHKKEKPLISIPQFWNFGDEASKKSKNNINFTKAEAVSFIFSVFLGGLYFWQKYWVVNNIIGLAFCVQAISLISVGSYKIGCILLSGLFFYDIFWVFGTDVMVSVAKSFDAPIKLLFPKDLFAETLQFSMLGLGDIVIPGFLIALLLRFDLKRSGPSKGKAKISDFSKPYFNVTFFAYLAGLTATIIIMHTYRAAQPALLYLVPFTIGASLGTAILRSEFGALWSYSEEYVKETKETSAQKKKPKLESSSVNGANKSPGKPLPKAPKRVEKFSSKTKSSKGTQKRNRDKDPRDFVVGSKW